MSQFALVWFRQDLRLQHHAALQAAQQYGLPIIPLFVRPPATHQRPRGAASSWWLHHSLQALAADIASQGGQLVLRSGTSASCLVQLSQQFGITDVFWNEGGTPVGMQESDAVEQVLRAHGIRTHRFTRGTLLVPPKALRPQGYQVFSAFWKALQNHEATHATLSTESTPSVWGLKGIASDSLQDWNLLPKVDWDAGLRATWVPGERGAWKRLHTFVKHALSGYATHRDQPGLEATSRLSAHLHFGEISPRAIWNEVQSSLASERDKTAFLRELAWREFSYHLLWYHPTLQETNLRPAFNMFPWKDNDTWEKAWQQGRTGYPLVDAGMRQLWQTGWMHNRVRMVTASFLVKDLGISWTHGERWFWDTLVDADEASNAVNWQWVAGCGVDAAPFFRIFNPVLQSKKFDPTGEYIRTYIPELRALPNRWIHSPWLAPPKILSDAGITLGKEYPFPLIDHHTARTQSLSAYAHMRLKNKKAEPL